MGALLLARKGDSDLLPPEIWQWIPAHVNLLLIGWMVQLAMGVAYWILPRLPNTRTKRGRFAFAIAAAVLLNGGVWLHVIAVMAAPWYQNSSTTLTLQTVGLMLQFLGAVSFALHIYPRVRATIVESQVLIESRT